MHVFAKVLCAKLPGYGEIAATVAFVENRTVGNLDNHRQNASKSTWTHRGTLDIAYRSVNVNKHKTKCDARR